MYKKGEIIIILYNCGRFSFGFVVCVFFLDESYIRLKNYDLF